LWGQLPSKLKKKNSTHKAPQAELENFFPVGRSEEEKVADCLEWTSHDNIHNLEYVFEKLFLICGPLHTKGICII